ncbi:MAG TPA: nucleotidyl transferase AbiEii/AbiGii toxin family protein [Gammaproteobacteria bacterium]|nr:nucleotidyl transferase AbiEii/AbiGii toxin family protein [Gammaproteobacteria bacterium]
MTIDIIEKRLKSYKTETPEDEQHALKEILQEIAIYALSEAGFFEKAIFHDGTALRILHELPRFSEDLDFMLKEPDVNFNWEPYLNVLTETFEQFGIQPEITDKSRVDAAVKKMFLKDDSIGKLIKLSFKHHPGKKHLIRFEIDANPPSGSISEIKFLEFPLDFSLVAHDLTSSFAGKCHALLCRGHIKGRDWYDFSWYVSNKITPNFIFLQAAIDQQGPWKNQSIQITPEWFYRAMSEKIQSIDWKFAANDVETFLNRQHRKTLALWSDAFFMSKLEKLSQLITQKS